MLGDRSGRLEEVGSSDRKGYIKVKCDCGTEKEIRKDGFRAGIVKSCGCLAKECGKKQGALNRKSLIGNTYGFLTVVGEEGSCKNGASIFRTCVCVCGKVVSINGTHLTRGMIQSCGCKTKELRKTTCLEKYGGNAPMCSETTKEKSKSTNLERYGHACSFQNEEVKAKFRKNFVDKYGVDNPTKNPEILAKARAAYSEVMQTSQYRSKEEKVIQDWVESLGLCTSHFSAGKYELDVFIPSLNIGIEYNGLHWHTEDRRGRKYHLDKTEFYAEKGIRVIHVWEHEWLTRQEQVKNFLKSALGKNELKIGARKCDFREINKREAWAFIDDRHIQPHNQRTTLAIGAYFEGKLVAVATFSTHHRDNHTPVLDRFVCEHGVTVSGALAKITKLASAHFKQKIVTWAHRTLSEGRGYVAAGWKQTEVLQPDYFYVSATGKAISKQARKKSTMKTPAGMTEAEHAKQDGLSRIYDCGKIRFEYDYLT